MNVSKKISAARIILVIFSVMLIAAGVILKDNSVIFRKAVFICMECIGIG